MCPSIFPENSPYGPVRGRRKQPMDNHKRPLSLHLLLPFMPLRSFFTTSLHHICIPLSQHSPSIITAQILYTHTRRHTNTTQNLSSPTAWHRAEFPLVIRLTQSNLYVVFLLCILAHKHTTLCSAF